MGAAHTTPGLFISLSLASDYHTRFSSCSDPAVLVRLVRIERKLDAIMAQLHVEMPDDGLQEVRDLAAAGEKISSIRLYRKLTHVGLAEAKAAVEAF